MIAGYVSLLSSSKFLFEMVGIQLCVVGVLVVARLKIKCNELID